MTALEQATSPRTRPSKLNGRSGENAGLAAQRNLTFIQGSQLGQIASQ